MLSPFLLFSACSSENNFGKAPYDGPHDGTEAHTAAVTACGGLNSIFSLDEYVCPEEQCADSVKDEIGRASCRERVYVLV